MGFFLCLLAIAFFGILFLIFRGKGSSQKTELCRKIETSGDLDYIFKFTTAGNYDINGNHVSYTTVSSHEDVVKAANDRLIRIAEECFW